MTEALKNIPEKWRGSETLSTFGGFKWKFSNINTIEE